MKNVSGFENQQSIDGGHNVFARNSQTSTQCGLPDDVLDHAIDKHDHAVDHIGPNENHGQG